MGTAGRKARKREQRVSGATFQHPVKAGTPLVERAWFNALVWGPAGTRHAFKQAPRSTRSRSRALLARGMDMEVK